MVSWIQSRIAKHTKQENTNYTEEKAGSKDYPRGDPDVRINRQGFGAGTVTQQVKASACSITIPYGSVVNGCQIDRNLTYRTLFKAGLIDLTTKYEGQDEDDK